MRTTTKRAIIAASTLAAVAVGWGLLAAFAGADPLPGGSGGGAPVRIVGPQGLPTAGTMPDGAVVSGAFTPTVHLDKAGSTQAAPGYEVGMVLPTTCSTPPAYDAGMLNTAVCDAGTPQPVSEQYSMPTHPAAGTPGSGLAAPLAVENELVAPDGGLVPGHGTAGGRKLMYVDTMCFDSAAGFELDSASIGPMGSVSLVGNQDYLITISDPSGDQGAVACWNRGTPIPSVDAGAVMADAGAMCYAMPKVIANSILKRAFAPNAPTYDAGTLNGTATLYFFATVSSGLAITLTPQVPCF